MNAHSW